MCIKLVSIKELYYDTRPTKSQEEKAGWRTGPNSYFSLNIIMVIKIILDSRNVIHLPRVAQREMHINVSFASLKGTYNLRD